MAIPVFPFWMHMTGQPDLFVQDLNGYNAALGLGYSLQGDTGSTANVDSTTSPSVVVAPGTTVVESPVSPSQPADVSQPAGQPDTVVVVNC